MKTPSRGTSPLGIALLCFIAAGFVVTIVYGLSKSGEKDSSAGERGSGKDSPLPMMPLGFRPKPKMIHGKIELIKVLPYRRPIFEDLPGIGRVRMNLGNGVKGEKVAWFKGPRGIASAAFRASLKLGDLPPLSIPIEPTSRQDVAFIHIPAYYPPGIDHGTLSITQQGRPMGAWKVSGLPRTRELWTVKGNSDEATYGPWGIRVSASYTPKGNAVGVCSFDFTTWRTDTGRSTYASQRWEVRRRLFPSQRFGLTVAPFESKSSLVYKQAVKGDTLAKGVEFGDFQKFAHVDGEFVRYDLYDEKVRFTGLTIEEAPQKDLNGVHGLPGGMSAGALKTRVFLLRGDRPISAVSETGIKVTLYPQENPKTPLLYDGGSHLYVNFRLSAGMTRPAKVPKSPITQNGKYDELLTLFPESGARIPISMAGNEDFDETAATHRDDDPGLFYDSGAPYLIAIDFTPGNEGKGKDLTLVLRHRVVLETRPFELVTPLKPQAVPRVEMRSAMPLPAPLAPR